MLEFSAGFPFGGIFGPHSSVEVNFSCRVGPSFFVTLNVR